MSGIYVEFDDLYVAIIMALTDDEIVSLPHDSTLEELAHRFPETYQACEETLRAQLIAQRRTDEQAMESTVHNGADTDGSKLRTDS